VDALKIISREITKPKKPNITCSHSFLRSYTENDDDAAATAASANST
jgi:hypothetical protein